MSSKYYERYDVEYRPTCFAKPRFDLLDPRYEFGVVQFSRGCPNRCFFCSVPCFSGTEIRRQTFADIYNDLTRVPQQRLFIADDNLYGHSVEDHQWATKLMAMIATENLDKRFVCQASLDVIRDDAFLEAAQAAGVRLILIGIEAADTTTLKSIGKQVNLGVGKIDFSRVHKHGIGILGAYVIGFDSDTPEILLDRAKFMVECGGDCSQLTIATPLPGTPFYRQLARQGRLLYTNYPEDWEKYDFSRLVYVPKGFHSEAHFYDVAAEFAEIAYSDQVLKSMAQRTYDVTKDWEVTGWAYRCNQSYGDVTRVRAKWWASHRIAANCL